MSEPEQGVNRQARLTSLLAEHGLAVLGRLSWPAETGGSCQLALVGDAGGRLWPAFTRSAEYADARSDPLDRWSRRVLGTIARSLDVGVIFPFDGPDFAPFVRWALASDSVWPSPLGLGIHRDYGLWHAYRAVLVLSGGTPRYDAEPDMVGVGTVPASNRPGPVVSPCVTCIDPPCLRSCPVSAFESAPEGDAGDARVPTARYRVDACLQHLHDGGDCMYRGCLARNACPYTPAGRYLPAQQQFHMRAFVRAFGQPATVKGKDDAKWKR